jgi:fucose 4-O-acetylase-like acetyltransferase
MDEMEPISWVNLMNCVSTHEDPRRFSNGTLHDFREILVVNDRIRSLDVLRGVLIILVVAGHLIQYTNVDYSNNVMFRFIYSFHMPLFFVASGIAAGIGGAMTRGDFVGYLRKSFYALLVPYGLWSSFVVFLNGGKGGDYISILVNPFRHYWFLDILFWTLLLVRLLTQRFSAASWCVYAILLCVMEIMSFASGQFGTFTTICYYFPFVYCGVRISTFFRERTEHLALSTSKSSIFALILLGALALLSVGWNYGSDPGVIHYVIQQPLIEKIGRYAYRLIIVLIAFGFFVLAYSLLSEKGRQYIGILGGLSIYIYIVHVVIIRCVEQLGGSRLAFPVWVILFTAIVIKLLRSFPRGCTCNLIIRAAFGGR